MEDPGESPITTRSMNFIQGHLPPDVSDPHSFLCDWDNKYSFVPTAPELEECLKAYTELLEYASGEHVLNVLDFSLMHASELALSHLNRAGNGGRLSVSDDVRGRLRSVATRIVTEIETSWGGSFRHYDAVKRIASIKEYLDEGTRS